MSASKVKKDGKLTDEQLAVLKKLSSGKKVYQFIKTRNTQASHIISKFGGVRPMVKALAAVDCIKTPSTIYRWIYGPNQGGTGGIIPTAVWEDVLKAARLQGIYLTSKDLDPRDTITERRKAIGRLQPDGEITPFIPTSVLRGRKKPV